MEKGKVSSSESDQSSTETDSTVKSQEDKAPSEPLDPQELAQRILEETQSHMRAVENLQRANGGGKTLVGPEGAGEESGKRASLSTPTTPTLTPTGGGLGFRPSETSAFSRPSSRASLKARSSPLSLSTPLSPLSTSLSSLPPTRPKPPSRSSSLQKISSGYNSPAHSSPSPSLSLSFKERSSVPLSSPSPSLSSDPQTQAQLKVKYPTSPYSTHISPSRSSSNLSVSPFSGNPSPAGSAPSPALSYSSTGSASARSSPADPTELNQLKRAALDDKVQAIHNLKTFWANATQKHDIPGPASILRSGNKKMSTVQKDVLGLLNLSPRQESASKNLEGSQDQSSDNPPNGHTKLESKPLPPPSPNASTNSKGSSPGVHPHPIRLPSGNGYKFLSPGRFFPSSKCWGFADLLCCFSKYQAYLLFEYWTGVCIMKETVHLSAKYTHVVARPTEN